MNVNAKGRSINFAQIEESRIEEEPWIEEEALRFGASGAKTSPWNS